MIVRGWVYVLTNKAMPGLLKIGYSTKDPSLRAEELDGTGLPNPFTVIYDVLVIHPREVEQQAHQELHDYHESKEFFRVDIDVAIETIRKVIANQGKVPFSETDNQPPQDKPRQSSKKSNEFDVVESIIRPLALCEQAVSNLTLGRNDLAKSYIQEAVMLLRLTVKLLPPADEEDEENEEGERSE